MPMGSTVQLYRGLLADLQTLPSTGKQGVLAWTTDSMQLFVDSGSGSGIGTAWLEMASDVSVFTAISWLQQLSLNAKVGDLCKRIDTSVTYILTAFPASVYGNWTSVAVSPLVGLAAPVASQWVEYVDLSGVQHLTQPAFSDIGGIATLSQLPASIGEDFANLQEEIDALWCRVRRLELLWRKAKANELAWLDNFGIITEIYEGVNDGN